MSVDAFVSYASPDSATAKELVAFLEFCGIRCWMAPRDVPGGSNYAEAILDALVEAQVVLLAFSENSNKSEHVRREIERALHHAKSIVPVRIEDVLPTKAMDYYLATLHWIDVFDKTSDCPFAPAAQAVATKLGREKDIAQKLKEWEKARQVEREAEEHRRELLEREATEEKKRIEREAEAARRAEEELEQRRRAEKELQRLTEETRRQQEEARIRREKEEARIRRENEEISRRKEALETESTWQRETQHLPELERLRSQAVARPTAPVSGSRDQRAHGIAWRRWALMAAMLLLVSVAVAGVWGWKGRVEADQHPKADQQAAVNPPSAVNPPALVNQHAAVDQNSNTDQHPPTDQNPKVDQTSKVDTPAVSPSAPYSVRGLFQWAGESHFAHSSFLKVAESGNRAGAYVDPHAGKPADELVLKFEPGSPSGLERSVELSLNIPGFAPVTRTVQVKPGENNADFGALTRLTGRVVIRSKYDHLPQALEAHRDLIQNLTLNWKGFNESAAAQDADAYALAERVHRLAPPAHHQLSVLSGEREAAALEVGVYDAVLTTRCQAPFDQISIGSVEVTPDGETVIEAPVVPIGVFGGVTAWTSTVGESGRDSEGQVTWTLINLPPEQDFGGAGPRVTLSYIDIVSEGETRMRFYFPAPVVAVVFDRASEKWQFIADPVSIMGTSVEDEIRERYFARIAFELSYHHDARELVFDAVTVDQPLNSTEGTKRAFPMRNAYRDFAAAVPKLQAPHPGSAVLNLKTVYDHLHALDQANAEAFRKSLTQPTSLATPLRINLGLIPDTTFEGSGSVRVARIEPNGPAAAAGLKEGDLIVSLAAVKIGNLNDFYMARFTLSEGVTAEVSIVRAGSPLTLAIQPVAKR